MPCSVCDAEKHTARSHQPVFAGSRVKDLVTGKTAKVVSRQEYTVWVQFGSKGKHERRDMEEIELLPDE